MVELSSSAWDGHGQHCMEGRGREGEGRGGGGGGGGEGCCWVSRIMKVKLATVSLLQVENRSFDLHLYIVFGNLPFNPCPHTIKIIQGTEK